MAAHMHVCVCMHLAPLIHAHAIKQLSIINMNMHSLCVVQLSVTHVSWLIVCWIIVTIACWNVFFLMFNWHSQILNVQWMFMCMHMQPNNYWYQNAYAAVCMHMMCACMCKLHVLFQYVLVCIKHQWHKIVWQINQNVLLQHPCSTTHVCNFLHTLSMQHALSMH